MTWRTLGTHQCELGESPFWQAHDARLYWVDITGCAALRADPATGVTERWSLPDEPGCMAPARTVVEAGTADTADTAGNGGNGGTPDGWVLALRSGIYRAHHWGGTLRRIARLPYDPHTQRANDGRCDPVGRFWVGTRDERPGGGDASMYCVDAREGPAQVQRVWGGASTLNGLAWSPDARTLYSADTPTHCVQARDWSADLLSGAAPRTLHQFAPKPAGWLPGQAGAAAYGGRPDGAAVDADGNYWCALYEGGRVVQLSPAGAVLQDIATPAVCPTMVCLGGADRRTLFVTTARHGRPAAELQQTPWAGNVLVLQSAVAVPGLPPQPFVEAASAQHMQVI